MLRKFLIQQNKPQRYFAEVLGVSQQAIQHWMAGRSLPSKAHIKDLATLCQETDTAIEAMINVQTGKYDNIPRFLPIYSFVADQLFRQSSIPIISDSDISFQQVDAISLFSFLSSELERDTLCRKMSLLYEFLSVELISVFYKSHFEAISLKEPTSFTGNQFSYFSCPKRERIRNEIDSVRNLFFCIPFDLFLDCIVQNPVESLYVKAVSSMSNNRKYEELRSILALFDTKDWVGLKRISQIPITSRIYFGNLKTGGRPLLPSEHVLLHVSSCDQIFTLKLLNELTPYAIVDQTPPGINSKES